MADLLKKVRLYTFDYEQLYFYLDGTTVPTKVSADNVLGSSTAHLVDQELPSGAVNGVNAVFTLAHTPNPAASLQLFENGLLQAPNASDFTLSGNQITFVVPPLMGSVLSAWYRY